MHSIHFSAIAEILSASLLEPGTDPLIENLLTDSRTLLFPETTAFFAISSAQRNANEFIPQLYENGVRAFIIDESFPTEDIDKFPDAGFILVQNTVIALQNLARHYRHTFNYPVIGITGSNGKTIVKEWLYQLMHAEYNIVRSPKSYNSQIGVPVSVWQMNDTHTLGIFEAGISKPGEMEQIAPVIAANIGIVTFIGEAHAKGFADSRQKINEKLLLFQQSEQLIYCKDDAELGSAVESFVLDKNKKLRLFSWGKDTTSTLVISSVEKLRSQSTIHAKFAGKEISFSIPFTDEAAINNAITCCCTLLIFGYDAELIRERMQQLRQVEMRLELKQGINNCSIINDSYSADISSLNIALDFLLQQQQHVNRTLILSDIPQTGLSSELLYKNVAAILEKKPVQRFIGIGEKITANRKAFEKIPNTRFYPTTDAMLADINTLHFFNESILLKGARLFRFEKITHALEQKMHETYLDINLNAIRHNLGVYRSKLSPGTRIMAMVKAFSYGSGSFEVANLLQHAGINYLGVAYADEGVELRKAGIRVPVMVMNTEAAGFESIIRYNLEPVLYSFNILRAFSNYLEANLIKDYKVHLKLDTGMHRLGFEQKDISLLLTELGNARALNVQSVFSHLAGSDDEVHDDFTHEQAATYIAMSAAIEKGLGHSFIKHLGNTAAIHRHPNLQMDMVRLGIGLYGVSSDPKMQQQLMNVSTLKTTISQIRLVKKGDSIGYSRKSVVTEDSMIATVRLGYADGYPRLLSNGLGKMLVNGSLAPVIGNVCMDMIMLNITGIVASEEDEVIVFGELLPVHLLAQWASTIPYEILTNISQRVKRVYFEE